MKSQSQDVHVCACNRRHGTIDSRTEYNEKFDSSLHDSYAARYFERLSSHRRGIDPQAEEVLR